MKKLRNAFAAGYSMLFATCVIAQTNVTTTGGTTNAVPVYTGSNTLGSSPISINGNNVGIGTTSSTSRLDVEGGSITIGGGVLHVPGGGDGTNPSVHFASYAPPGFNPGANLGIWLGSDFYIHANAGVNVASGSVSGNSQVYNALTLQPFGGSAFSANGSSLFLNSVTNSGINPIAGIWSSLGSGGNGGVNYDGSLVFASTHQGNSTPTEGMRLDQYGNVGIGTALPGAKLEVSGSVKLTGGSGTSMTYADGTVQSTAWTGVLTGGDYAESVDVIGERAQYQPGDLLMIDAHHPDKFLRSSHPYSQMIAGVFSTKPGVIGRRMTTAKSAEEVPMAITGIVPTKVSAENGAIKPGDLLVSSSSAGYAMHGTNRKKMMGAVIGKAMGSLDAGKGLIEVLVYLQ